ncbi:hypothetical protein V8068_001213 [Vibrio parahaemolyticus]|nr:hypothetical protein [Vibrio parahaemolyticus]
MTDIYINLDEQYIAKVINKTLLELLSEGGFYWHPLASCATQEADGEIIWWSAPVEEVKEARANKDSYEYGLIPLIGIGQQVNVDYYLVNDESYAAKDWETAVITIDEIGNHKCYA